MVMKQRAVVGLASDHFTAWRDATTKAKMLDLWARGDNVSPLMPQKADTNPEYESLADVSPTPWAHLIISAVAQSCAVVDHVNTGDGNSTKTFAEVWKPNGLLSRQGAVMRGALGHNLSYVTTLPGKRPHTDKATARVRGVSATKMTAFYDDEAEDDFARFAMFGEIEKPDSDDPFIAWKLYDEEAEYFLASELDGSRMTYIEHRIHDVGVTPVHRFTPRLDLEGRATGEIQPVVPLLRRLDQDSFDRLIVQRFNSWRVRYIAGMVKPKNEQEKRAAALALRVEDLLVSENPDTRFGTLDATDLTAYIKAHDQDVQDLAAVTQTPPHHLLGQIANLSADALAAAEASLMRKVEEYQLSFAQSWDSVMRSCAFILAKSGDREGYIKEATDYETEIKWKDTQARSLAQTVDALGKAAEMLGIPVEMLWEEVPFWKKGDTERAKELLKESGMDAQMLQFLDEAIKNGQRQQQTYGERAGGAPAE